MSEDLLKRIGWFMVYVMAQVMVLNRIHLLGVATPLLFVYFVLQLPRNCPKWESLLWAFVMGLFIDIFTNTPGLAAASLTLVAAVQPYYFELFLSRDAAKNIRPSLAAMGLTRYLVYSTPLVLLMCTAFFSLETLSFFNWQHWLLCIAGSTVITMLLIVTFEIAKSR